MIITKEGEEFQNLLKKVEYLENVIRCSKYYAGCDPYKEYGDCAIKKGAWVRSKYSKIPFKFGYWERDGRIYDIDGLLRREKLEYLEIMSDIDIKAHLVKVAHQKALVGWRKFRWKNEEEVTTINPGQGHEYVRSVDALTVGVGEDCTRRAIYMDGEWATPIFDLTNLPKTVSEFEQVLKDFCKDLYGSDSLCEIHTDVDNFLRRHNYK
jgi:hypothetical protein